MRGVSNLGLFQLRWFRVALNSDSHSSAVGINCLAAMFVKNTRTQCSLLDRFVFIQVTVVTKSTVLFQKTRRATRSRATVRRDTWLARRFSIFKKIDLLILTRDYRKIYMIISLFGSWRILATPQREGHACALYFDSCDSFYSKTYFLLRRIFEL